MRIVVPWLRELVDIPVGTEALAETLGLRGFEVAEVDVARDAIDFEITANRPDCLSHLGFAREASAVFDAALAAHSAAVARVPATPGEEASVSIEDPVGCPRYAGQVARVAVRPSPDWLASRLLAAGVRPINNIVDVTNYVMLEIGQPMHAFDLERLGGRAIRVRRARPGELLRTLDGEKRTLDETMLVIADAEQAQAIAGVMGGADSEVSASTRLILLESAYFQPATVRRTSRVLGLKTEASARFERGADPGAQVTAIDRACGLLIQIGAGEAVGPALDRCPGPVPRRRVGLRAARIAHLLGLRVDRLDVERILTRLGFGLAARSDGWDVTVPTWRVDVAREADLIEEVGRHVGYDRLPSTFPVLDRMHRGLDPRIRGERLARATLTGAGFFEAVTFAFIEQAAAEPFVAASEDVVRVANPLSEKFAVLRPSLLPGLVDSIGHNRRRELRDVRLFEIGAVFSRRTAEGRRVALAWTGRAIGEHWSGGARDVDLFDVKGAIEALARTFHVGIEVAAADVPFLAPGRAATIRASGAGAPALGVVGLLAPAVIAARGLPAADEVWAAEIDVDALDRLRGDTAVRVTALPRYPSVVRDLSVEVDETLPAGVVRGTIRQAAPPTLVSVREFDRYRGKGVPEGRVSLSFRLTFRAPDRTLTDAEVQAAMTRLVAAVAEAHGATQR